MDLLAVPAEVAAALISMMDCDLEVQAKYTLSSPKLLLFSVFVTTKGKPEH